MPPMQRTPSDGLRRAAQSAARQLHVDCAAERGRQLHRNSILAKRARQLRRV